MKRITIALCALAMVGLAVWAQARTVTVVVGGVAEGGGPAAWYYSNGSDSYDDSGSESGNYAIGSDVTVTTGGSITKLSIKATGTSVDNTKIALYDTSGNRLNAGCATSGISVGWNDCTLGTPYTVSNGATVRVIFDCNDNYGHAHNNTGMGYWASQDFSTFPPATLSLNEDNGKMHAVRVYVD